MTVFVTALIIFTVAGCSPKNDATNSAQARETADNAGTNQSATEKAIAEAMLATAKAMDLTASGGQPGTITTFGAFYNADGARDPRIEFRNRTGYGWRGRYANLNATTIQNFAAPTESTAKEIESLKADESYIQLGCEDMPLPPLGSLREIKIDREDQVSPLIVKAHTVVLCLDANIKNPVAVVTADTVYLALFRHTMSGFSEKTISINSRVLSINGSSVIESRALGGETTVLDGPSVTLTASKVIGDGTLLIDAYGADYVKKPVTDITAATN